MGQRRSPLLKRTRWCAAFGCTDGGLKNPRIANHTPNLRDQDGCKVADTRKFSKSSKGGCCADPKNASVSTRPDLWETGTGALVKGVTDWISDRGSNLFQASQAGFHSDTRVARVDDVGARWLSMRSSSLQRILGHLLKSAYAHQGLSHVRTSVTGWGLPSKPASEVVSGFDNPLGDKTSLYWRRFFVATQET